MSEPTQNDEKVREALELWTLLDELLPGVSKPEAVRRMFNECVHNAASPSATNQAMLVADHLGLKISDDAPAEMHRRHIRIR